LLNERITRLNHHRYICNHRADLLRESFNTNFNKMKPTKLEKLPNWEETHKRMMRWTFDCPNEEDLRMDEDKIREQMEKSENAKVKLCR